MQSRISSSLTETQNLRKELTDARPAQEWQESFGTYTKALDSYTKYLNAMEAKVQSGDKSDSQELNSLKQEWQGYVDSSVSAMPIGK
jgi:chemotaxis regulatin CheY-phosphate phosphatase CheZ